MSVQASRYAPGTTLWAKVPEPDDSEQVWVKAEITDVDDNQVHIVTVEGDRLKIGANDRIYLCNAEVEDKADGLAGIDDLTALTHLHEPEVLQALHFRFDVDRIYTFTGPILIAVNPFKQIPRIYDDRTLMSFMQPRPKTPPHVYAIASRAYFGLTEKLQSQVVLISGESGAGKTETMKIVLKFLAEAASQQRGKSSIEQRILESNPLLEAFGNACTVRNNNSSRFGKFIELMFNLKDHGCQLAGASIDTYLLEKVRLTELHDGERNYHIFYQACAAKHVHGAKLGHISLEHFGDGKSFTYMNRSERQSIPGVDDSEAFEETLAAMKVMNISNEEQQLVVQIVCAILHLGNSGFGRGDKADCAGDASFQLACSLLGVETKVLAEAMCNKLIIAPTDRYLSPLGPEQASSRNGALVRVIYGLLFTFLVVRVNEAIQLSGKLAGTHFCGVLDIFGFEHFKVNSFEQLCINFTNERLQQFFNQFVFKEENRLYQEEGISTEAIEFPDNQDVIDLISGKQMSIFVLLDEECRIPKGLDKSFCSKLHKEHQNHPRFGIDKRKVEWFIVKHFAGPVSYLSDGFMDKNKDELGENIVEAMKQTKLDFIQNLFSRYGAPAAGGEFKPPARGGKAFKSVSSEFKLQLDGLMTTLKKAEPNFIRCIKPNPQQMREVFNRRTVAEQLRSGGVIEALQVQRAGYPCRFKHRPFWEDYHILIVDRKVQEQIKKTTAVKERLTIMLKYIETTYKLPKTSSGLCWALGKTLVFFKQEAFETVQCARLTLRTKSATKIQSSFRQFQMQRIFSIFKMCIIYIQAHWRGYTVRKANTLDRMAKVRARQKQVDEERKKKEAEEQKKAEQERLKREEEERKRQEEEERKRREAEERRIAEQEERRRKAEEEERRRLQEMQELRAMTQALERQVAEVQEKEAAKRKEYENSIEKLKGDMSNQAGLYASREKEIQEQKEQALQLLNQKLLDAQETSSATAKAYEEQLQKSQADADEQAAKLLAEVEKQKQKAKELEKAQAEEVEHLKRQREEQQRKEEAQLIDLQEKLAIQQQKQLEDMRQKDEEMQRQHKEDMLRMRQLEEEQQRRNQEALDELMKRKEETQQQWQANLQDAQQREADKGRTIAMLEQKLLDQEREFEEYKRVQQRNQDEQIASYKEQQRQLEQRLASREQTLTEQVSLMQNQKEEQAKSHQTQLENQAKTLKSNAEAELNLLKAQKDQQEQAMRGQLEQLEQSNATQKRLEDQKIALLEQKQKDELAQKENRIQQLEEHRNQQQSLYKDHVAALEQRQAEREEILKQQLAQKDLVRDQQQAACDEQLRLMEEMKEEQGRVMANQLETLKKDTDLTRWTLEERIKDLEREKAELSKTLEDTRTTLLKQQDLLKKSYAERENALRGEEDERIRIQAHIEKELKQQLNIAHENASTLRQELLEKRRKSSFHGLRQRARSGSVSLAAAASSKKSAGLAAAVAIVKGNSKMSKAATSHPSKGRSKEILGKFLRPSLMQNERICDGPVGVWKTLEVASAVTIVVFGQQRADSMLLAAACKCGTVFVFSLERTAVEKQSIGSPKAPDYWTEPEVKEILRFQSHKKAATFMCFGTLEEELLTTSTDGNIRLWNLANGQLMRELQDSSVVISALPMPGTTNIVAANANSILRLVLGSGDVMKTRLNHYARCLALCPGGKVVLAGTHKGSVHSVEVSEDNLRTVGRLQLTKAAITCLTVAPSPDAPLRILANCMDSTVCVLEMNATGTHMTVLHRTGNPHKLLPLRCCYVPGGDGSGYVVAGAEDCRIHVTELSGSHDSADLENVVKAPVIDCDVTRDHTLLATGDAKCSVVLWRRIGFL
eukprot:gnl/MRDRNA2_/MRDRNA2_79839_c0_seq2.p1 gnl/MRDRNA2_/MRDRNA2_79839_c0~~gnl/MRDRNA2_/MRDRNA2_79839_c0_seq2.p1  ORF type:complete len:1840 (+),score=496.69 gnl/MRDRNA2_/MRDRNA2_79839_c0_seq2:156-5675(+)